MILLGKAGGAGQVRQGASQHIVAMVPRPGTSLEWWQESHSPSPGAPAAGTLTSGLESAWTTAGKSWAIPCSTYLWFSPERKPRSRHPWEQHRHIGTFCSPPCTLSPCSPEGLCLRPPCDHATVLPSVSSSGSAMRVCKCRGVFIPEPLVPSCKLDKYPQARQPCSALPVSGIKKKSEVPG